jgi:hypothetical protein
MRFVNNWSKKPYTAFVEVVEVKLIYNFPIYRLDHFSSKILRKSELNRASPKHFCRGTRARATSSRNAASTHCHPAVHACRRRPWSAGSRAVGPPWRRTAFLPHSPCATRRARHGQAEPTVPPLVHWSSRRTPPHVGPVPRAHAATSASHWRVRTAFQHAPI